MRAQQTRYAVAGWGVGELWTSDQAVLAHDFTYAAELDSPTAKRRADPNFEDTARARPPTAGACPPKGAERPPTGTLAATSRRVGHGFVPTSAQPTAAVEADELVSLFTAFLGGFEVSLGSVPLDLDGSTPFQHAVAASLRTIRRGEVVGYAELAAMAGYPGAQRAVGTFCARNRFAFLLPCHRVVAADGIGGYGSAGVGVKRRLLALEGVVL